MKVRSTQSREGVKGGLRPFSSAPCRVKGQRPLWGLGQRPNCFADNQFKEKRSSKGAGSEASLPVTLRSRRSAPKLLYSNIYAVSRQMGATEEHGNRRSLRLPSGSR